MNDTDVIMLTGNGKCLTAITVDMKRLNSILLLSVT